MIFKQTGRAHCQASAKTQGLLDNGICLGKCQKKLSAGINGLKQAGKNSPSFFDKVPLLFLAPFYVSQLSHFFFLRIAVYRFISLLVCFENAVISDRSLLLR